MIHCEPIDKAAGVEVVQRHYIAVEQNNRRSCSALNVVQANPIDGGKASLGRMLALSASSLELSPQRGGGGKRYPGYQCGA